MQGALTGAAGDHDSLSQLATVLAAQHTLQLLEVDLTETQACCWLHESLLPLPVDACTFTLHTMQHPMAQANATQPSPALQAFVASQLH